MIQCHALSLLRPELRESGITAALLWIDGLVAPAFMLAAGFALGLLQVRSVGASDRSARRWKTLRRIGEVLAVATLVNAMWFNLLEEPKWFFRVDILHCIGLSLLVVFPFATLLAHRPRLLTAVGLVMSGVIFFVAPFGEAVEGPWAMLANKSTGAVFPLLPWTAYVFLGAALGAQAAKTDGAGLARRLGVLGAVAAVVWAATPLLRDAYPPHAFGTFNPAEHARRLTVLVLLLLGFLHVEHRRPALRGTPPFRSLNVFGTTSLAAYFFHEALLYKQVFGFSFDAVWGDRSGWAQYTLLTITLVAITFGLCWITDHAYRAAGRVVERVQELLSARPEPDPGP